MVVCSLEFALSNSTAELFSSSVILMGKKKKSTQQAAHGSGSHRPQKLSKKLQMWHLGTWCWWADGWPWSQEDRSYKRLIKKHDQVFSLSWMSDYNSICSIRKCAAKVIKSTENGVMILQKKKGWLHWISWNLFSNAFIKTESNYVYILLFTGLCLDNTSQYIKLFSITWAGLQGRLQ